MRQASITTSWVADEKATAKAQATVAKRPCAGSVKAMPTRPSAMPSCETTIQARRRPRKRARTGMSTASTIGAHRNLSV
jgi:hypothetical protein